MVPVKPKRPLSAYFIWLNSARKQLKRDNPNLRVTEIARLGGQLWRNMKDKTIWLKRAKKAKRDYMSALSRYKARGGDMSVKSRRKKRNDVLNKRNNAPTKRSSNKKSYY